MGSYQQENNRFWRLNFQRKRIFRPLSLCRTLLFTNDFNDALDEQDKDPKDFAPIVHHSPPQYLPIPSASSSPSKFTSLNPFALLLQFLKYSHSMIPTIPMTKVSKKMNKNQIVKHRLLRLRFYHHANLSIPDTPSSPQTSNPTPDAQPEPTNRRAARIIPTEKKRRAGAGCKYTRISTYAPNNEPSSIEEALTLPDGIFWYNASLKELHSLDKKET